MTARSKKKKKCFKYKMIQEEAEKERYATHLRKRLSGYFFFCEEKVLLMNETHFKQMPLYLLGLRLLKHFNISGF